MLKNIENHRHQSSCIAGNYISSSFRHKNWNIFSAGIGRTGCFIGLSNGIEQLNSEHEIDVVRIICNLRRDRGGMIQTHDQYQFLYLALSEYARTLS